MDTMTIFWLVVALFAGGIITWYILTSKRGYGSGEGETSTAQDSSDDSLEIDEGVVESVEEDRLPRQ